jgi:hypothetical protein
MVAERRASVRVDVDRVPAELIVSIDGHLSMSAAHILNLSAGGALIEVTQGWPIGTEIRCDFSLPGGVSILVSGEVVRRIEPELLSNVRRLAIHFWTRPGTDSRLMHWVLDEIAQRRKLGKT